MKNSILRYLLPVALFLFVVEYFFEYHLEIGFVKYGFFSWYGFLACALLVFISLGVGKLVKRRDDYYDENKPGDKN